MPIPPPSNAAWSELVAGTRTPDLETLAIKIFLGRAKLVVKRDAASAGKLAGELHDLVVKNERLPSVQKDLVKMFG